MDRTVTRCRVAAMLGAAATLVAGCSRTEPPPAVEAPAATPVDISIPGTGVFPESLTAGADGSIYIGSVGLAQIYRVPPGGSAAEVFIAPGTGGMKQIFGVLADDASGTLWACSNELGGGPPGASSGPSALHSFDLASGMARASHAFPQGGMCNDIAVGAGGEVYATDTPGMQILRLPKDGMALEVWSPAGAFGETGGVLDGIAMVGGRVIVNTLRTNKLFAVEVGAQGQAGAVTELTLSSPVQGPDGMRTLGTDGLLTTDSTGKIQHVIISGGEATVHTVKDGLEGAVSVAVVGNTAYALEGQLGIMFAGPGGEAPAEKPYRAVAFTLP